MTKFEDPSDFLTGDYAHDNDIKSFIPLDEGKYVEKEFDKKDGTGGKEKKTIFEWTVNCSNGKQKTYSPNATSIKTLMKISDGDSKILLGKIIPIIVSLNAGKWIVYVSPDFTKEKLLAQIQKQEEVTQ